MIVRVLGTRIGLAAALAARVHLRPETSPSSAPPRLEGEPGMHATLTVESRPIALSRRPRPRVALIGNPNAGKTTLFNRLTGLRAKTANFPGTTLERRVGTIHLADGPADLEDLPGLYALTAGNVEERVARDHLCGTGRGRGRLGGHRRRGRHQPGPQPLSGGPGPRARDPAPRRPEHDGPRREGGAADRRRRPLARARRPGDRAQRPHGSRPRGAPAGPRPAPSRRASAPAATRRRSPPARAAPGAERTRPASTGPRAWR